MKIPDTIINMTNNNIARSSYTLGTIHFGPSYNKGESYNDVSTSQVFLDDLFRSENSSAPVLARILVVDDEPDINLVRECWKDREVSSSIPSMTQTQPYETSRRDYMTCLSSTLECEV